VEGGGDKTKIFSFKGKTAKEASTRCLECHGQSDEHGAFLRSKHARNDVGCNSCHSVHKSVPMTRLLSQKPLQLCYGCHTEVKAEFLRPSHHRVNEGLVTCNDCHSPHGGTHDRQLRANATGDAACFKCHSDKLGPFTFEHPPVKAEGCTACHTPHASTTQRMLKRASVNVMCLECHSQTLTQVAQAPQVLSQPPAGPAHNQQQGRFQSCTLCHQFIHGSNSSPVFFKP
jgi:DmsE family decaheme c-type cytochrome